MKGAASSILVVLLFLSSFVLISNIHSLKAESRTWIVDDDGLADFHTIQEAINAAISGDTILVHSGTYYENVVVNKTVSLVGENKSTTIIDAHGIGSAVVIAANGSTITGFTAQNSDIYQCGIGVNGSRTTITHNIVRNNYYGIVLKNSANNSVIGNEVYSSSELGIALGYANNNTLVDNKASDNRKGIHLSYSGNNTLAGNVMENNDWNFGVYGGYDANFENDINTSNLVDGKPIYYLKRISSRVYNSSTNAGAIFLINSMNVTVRDLSLTKNIQNAFFWKTPNSRIENLTVSGTWDAGVALYFSDNSTIAGSKVSDSYYGIQLESSNNIKIIDNYLYANWDYGIFLRYSNNCTIKSNIATDTVHGPGIEASDSNDDTIFGNTVSRNINGILLRRAANNTVIQNVASHNNFGIGVVANSHGNSITDNDVLNNIYGVNLSSSPFNNIVSGNIISSNSEYGFRLWGANNNMIFHNNILSNPVQVYNYDSTNTWDDDYPSGGNYWSNYAGMDLCSGPYQNMTGSDGIGDLPYVIPGLYGTPNDVDRYPLMNAYETPRSYFLTITTTNGGITSPASGTYNYTAGSIVEVTAIPNANYTFGYWELDWANLGSANPINITIVAPHRLRAVFQRILHDVAISDVSSSNLVVGQGYTKRINITVANQGNVAEAFSVLMYEDTTLIGIWSVNLSEGTHTVLVWNATGVAIGCHTQSIYASPVSGETDTTNNNATIVVTVTIPGDVNGDFKVDISDATLIGMNWRHYAPPAPANVDINGDSIIDISDATIVGLNWQKHA